MSTHPDPAKLPGTRHLAAEEIITSLARFPLILDILDQLAKAPVPLPGDEEIRHGCERSLTAMLRKTALIKPATGGTLSTAEKTVLGWLRSKRARQLIHPDQLMRIEQFVERALGPQQHSS